MFTTNKLSAKTFSGVATQKPSYKTSMLWWLGFGMRMKFTPVGMTLTKGWKSVTISYSEVRGVHTERRFFRGHTLVVNTFTKPIRFRMTKRGATKAHTMIQSQMTNNFNPES